MRILLYNPDNGVTRNFMPHLWMFLLKALTPAGHEVVLIDGNAQPMDEAAIARFVLHEKIGFGRDRRDDTDDRKSLSNGRRDSRCRRARVMGGPHVTEMADEALGRSGGPRHADAVALGESGRNLAQNCE